MSFSDKYYQSFFERLEDRVLLDGVPDATFISMPTDHVVPNAPQASPLNQFQAATGQFLIRLRVDQRRDAPAVIGKLAKFQ